MAGGDGRWIHDVLKYGDTDYIRFAVSRNDGELVFCIEDIEMAAGYETMFPAYRKDRFFRSGGRRGGWELEFIDGRHYANIGKIRREYFWSPLRGMHEVTEFLAAKSLSIVSRHYHPQEVSGFNFGSNKDANARIDSLIARVNDACAKADAVLNRNRESAA